VRGVVSFPAATRSTTGSCTSNAPSWTWPPARLSCVDDEDRENEGDLIFAAERATPELVSFMVRYTSGYICVALTEGDCDRLDLPRCTTPTGTASVRLHRQGGRQAGHHHGHLGTRPARTQSAAGQRGSARSDFVRPGHVLPLRAGGGGVLRRPGHTEAAVDLAGWPGCNRPAHCARSSRRRTRATWPAPTSCGCSPTTRLALVTIAELIAYRRRFEKQVERVGRSPRSPPRTAVFVAYGYDNVLDGIENIALVYAQTR